MSVYDIYALRLGRPCVPFGHIDLEFQLPVPVVYADFRKGVPAGMGANEIDIFAVAKNALGKGRRLSHVKLLCKGQVSVPCVNLLPRRKARRIHIKHGRICHRKEIPFKAAA